MKFHIVSVIIMTLLVLAACENNIARPAVDGMNTDDIVIGDTEGIPTDNATPADADNGSDIAANDDDAVGTDDIAIDDILPDDATDEIAVDKDSIPEDDCAFRGGVCVSGLDCPGGYTASPQFNCDAAICCMATGVTGLRIDVTGPQPIPGTLLSIPAVMPTPSQGGTGTPAITSDLGPTALVVIGLIEENIDGCKEYANRVDGALVLVQRGNCTFSQKITNAQNAGALAIIIYNNVPGDIGMNADGTLPTVGITQANGDAIIAFTQENPTITAAIRP